MLLIVLGAVRLCVCVCVCGSLVFITPACLPPRTEYYSNCEVQYKGLPNIHDVYRSFSDLRSLLASNIKR